MCTEPKKATFNPLLITINPYALLGELASIIKIDR